MSVWQTPLGLGIGNNPLTDSPYVDQEDYGNSYPPGAQRALLTEGGAFILTEGTKLITTE